MKDVVLTIAGILIFIGITYGGYWAAKNISYSIFYESLVEQTIKDNVKGSCLKGGK